jgi:hypothetical protein
MRGLFISKKPVPDGPPTYDEAVQDQQPVAAEEKPKFRSSPGSFETAKGTKEDSIHASSAKLAPTDQSEPSRIR